MCNIKGLVGSFSISAADLSFSVRAAEKASSLLCCSISAAEVKSAAQRER